MATTTTMNTVKTFDMLAHYTDTHLILTGTDDRGTRTLSVDLARCLAVATDAEATLINETRSCGDKGEQFVIQFTRDELITLANLVSRANSAPVQSATSRVAKKAQMAEQVIKSAQHAAVMAEREAAKNARGMGCTEVELNSLDRMARTLSGDVYKLTYDIPKVKNEACPSPCALLWSVGAFPASESDWVIREESLSHPTVQRMIETWKANGTGPDRVKFWLVRYHPDDLNIVRQQAVEALDARVREVKASIVENILAADERLTAAQKELDTREVPATEHDRLSAERARDNRVRSILKGAWEELSRLVKVAETFEETDSVREVIRGLRQTVAANAASFNAAMAVKGSKLAPTE